ncbi:MAG: stage III sporulation protein AG [Lachnoclostridium sp.]|nr:stage III sporulation protein AG [Lachnospira sp.]MCM1248417.1 stage III sporulation protein AG [Lachnoclostridium sp.]
MGGRIDRLQKMIRKIPVKESWKQWFKKRDNLVILVLAGILLFIIALPVKTGEKSESGRQGEEAADLNAIKDSSKTQGELYTYTDFSEDAYRKKLERELEEILSNAYGVGKVRAMITLSASPEIVIEKDNTYSRSQTNETDSEGGSRIITQTEEQESTVYKAEGSENIPYVVKTLFPQVKGVVVVAQGAGKGSVDKNITEIVQALFDLEANEVKVVKMQETN